MVTLGLNLKRSVGSGSIPKLIHYVWVGGRPLPARFLANIKTWKRHNPEYTVVCWDERSIDASDPFIARAREERAWAKLSDFVRLKVIQDFGGIYLDTDVEVIRSFDGLLSEHCFVGYQKLFEEDDPVCNAVIGARPQHPFILEALETFPREDPRPLNQVGTGPELLSHALVSKGLPPSSSKPLVIDGVTVLPRAVFYPYHWSETYHKRCIRPETLAVHHWDMSWHRDGASLLRRVVVDGLKARPRLYRALRASYHRVGRPFRGDPCE